MVDSSKNSVLTISADRPFVDVFAAGLLHETENDPLKLADYTILLPTRRACKALTEAFLRQSGGTPLILPALRALGDTDEDGLALEETPGLDIANLPPAIPEARRLMMLANRILAWRSVAVGTTTAGQLVASPDQALHLAGELARFLDQVQTERLAFDGLEALVPEDLAAHWQETLEFLRYFTDHWPREVENQGFLEPVERRNQLLAEKARQWAASPPRGDIIAAGSTGSIPATADLLGVITKLPRGRVVLPGLDLISDPENWSAIEKDPTHPQFSMAHLLRRIDVSRSSVVEWYPSGLAAENIASAPPVSPRVHLIQEFMRPAETTLAWQSLLPFEPAALAGVSLLECANETEEAGVIALILRHTLEQEGKTGALVTSDRRLARRVATALSRWEIDIDDSAGVPLSETPPAIFMRLVAKLVEEGFGPVSLLAAGKHPLAAAGYDPAEFRSLMRQLDRKILRGPRPASGIAGIRAVIEAADQRTLDDKIRRSLFGLLDALDEKMAPITRLAGTEAGLAALVDAHIAAAEALADSHDETGASRLWAGENGEALALFFADLREAADAFPSLDHSDYPAVLEALLGRNVVRPRYGKHPRLNIWGPLEARLQQADCLIIGGLNEGTWPREPGPDPWFSRPMRQRFGLPLPEQRIGLSAHDFAQALAGPEVILTRARKVDGAPAVPTRWLSRLRSVLTAAGDETGIQKPRQWLEWHQTLSRPQQRLSIAPPAPRPPLEARPRKLSVTRIETWMRDPYAIYARYILGLYKLDPLEADPGAADRGTIIHEALDLFLRAYPDVMPPNPVALLLEIGEEVFGAALARPAVRAFWWPRFVRIAEWFAEVETARRVGISGSHSEAKGSLVIEAANGPFTVTAIADRVDLLKGGGIEIIDYKTGGVPSMKEVELGYAPQLSLEAVIAEHAGFEGLAADTVTALSYWRLTGGDPAGAVKIFAKDLQSLSEDAFMGLTALVESFDKLETAYAAIPVPAYKPRFNDFDHLERVLEWSDSEVD